jgi:hypothetical protein
VATIIEGIDLMLHELHPGGNFQQPFEIPFATAADILRRIERTLEMSTEEGYDFDWEAARAALRFMSDATDDPGRRGHVWCLVRRDRNMNRFINIGARQTYSDAPDTAHVEGRIAQGTAIESPMLMLFRQNGHLDQGWRGTPFYWPVIVAQQNLRTSIFAHETMA